MIKKILSITLIAMFILPAFASAYTFYENTNPSIWSTPTYDAYYNRYISTFDKSKVSYIELGSYPDGNYNGTPQSFKTIQVPSGAIDFRFGCNTHYKMQAFNSSGNLLSTLRFEATEIINPDPNICFSNINPDTDTGSGTCDACALLDCPGWSEYMSKLDDIKASIPPPPNWQAVANTFRDTITPKIKQDLIEIIGSTPEATMPALPNAPNKPTAPPDEVVNGFSLPKPTGQEAQGLEEAGFNKSEIEQEAPIIQEREDPTGGFNIIDPIGNLPSQDEFIKNAPNEGEAPLPAPPIEQDNNSPYPSDTTDTAPIPTDEATAPIPNENMTAPLPDSDNSTAPIPGQDSQFVAPIP